MTIGQILEKGFTPIEHEGIVHYRLDLEHLIFDGLHIIVHVKHDLIVLYGIDINSGNEVPFYEALMTEKNLIELLNYLTPEAKEE